MQKYAITEESTYMYTEGNKKVVKPKVILYEPTTLLLLCLHNS